MKRYLGAFGAAALVFATVLGSAAALDIQDPGVVQFGKATNLQCDKDGVVVEGYFLETNQNRVSTSHGVVVSDISAKCFGRTIVVRTFNEPGASLARGFTEIDGHTERVSYEDSQSVPAEDIAEVQITIG